MKNYLIKTLIKAVKPWITPHSSQTKRRFLIVTTTALGDTLWATPAIESLRASFPDSYIAALTSPIGAQILERNPHLSKIYLFAPFSYTLWKTLYRDQFDTILLFHASQRMALPLCALLGAKQIIGTSTLNKGFDSLLTDPMPPRYEHQIVRRLKIMERAGGKITTQTLSFFLQAEEKRNTSEKLKIAIHPGSKDIFKRWPAKNFSTLGQALKKQFDCDLFITGSKGEEELVKQVAQSIPGAQIFDSKLNLRSLAAFLDQTDLLISNDTGPFHLACALNRPAIAIYSSTDPELCGPHLAPKGIAISRKPTCEPCLKRKCRAPFCFLQIGTCEVLDACLKILS